MGELRAGPKVTRNESSKKIKNKCLKSIPSRTLPLGETQKKRKMPGRMKAHILECAYLSI